MSRRLSLLLALLALLAVPATADTGGRWEEALRAFGEGRFETAAAIGVDLGTADGLALAARATLVRGTYLVTPEERPSLYRAAAAHAEAALARDPGHVEARLQLVVALGSLGRETDPIAAHVAGYADTAKEILDSVISEAPDNPFAHAILGAWHAEIVHHAGPLLAASLYGASADGALRAFERADALSPESVLVQAAFAKAVLRIDPSAHLQTAKDLLDRAESAGPRDMLEWLVLQETAAYLGEVGHRVPQRLGGRG